MSLRRDGSMAYEGERTREGQGLQWERGKDVDTHVALDKHFLEGRMPWAFAIMSYGHLSAGVLGLWNAVHINSSRV